MMVDGVSVVFSSSYRLSVLTALFIMINFEFCLTLIRVGEDG